MGNCARTQKSSDLMSVLRMWLDARMISPFVHELNRMLLIFQASLVAQTVENMPAIWKTQDADPPTPGIEPLSLTPALAGGFFTTRATWKAPT